MKTPKVAHSAEMKKGMGDFYKGATRAKIGTTRDSYMPGATATPKKMLKVAPKKLG